MRILYIYTAFIFFCSTPAEAQSNWTPVSPDFFPTNASGQIHGLSRVSQVKFHPTNANKMYAVSSRGGLFITSNAGANWTIAPGCDILPQMRLNSVCIDYTNDQVLYLGSGDANYYYAGSGIYKSVNGGNTFTSSGLSGRLVVEILMNPANNQVLIAATDAGIYKSTNAGSTWTLKTSSALACRDMLFKASTGTQTLYACTYSDLYRSTDMGETWTQLTTGIYIPSGSTTGGGCRIAVTPADSNLVYFAMIAKNGTIFKSTNGGNSFVNVKDSIMPNLTAYDNTTSSTGQGDYNCMFSADPVNPNTLYFGSHNFWKSTTGGSSWTKMTSWWAVLHTDMHWVKVNPYNTSQIWTANDGGVWLSTDGGTNWTPKSDGIYGYEIYHGNCSPTRRDMFSIGTQDNGELYHSSGTWFTNRGGDWGSQCAFDYRTNSSMVYYYQNNKRRLVNGSDQTYGLPIASLQDIAFYRANPNLAFAANLDVYRTTNLQNSTPIWTQISSINKTIKAVHVNLADSNKLYIVTNDANLYVSSNALSATPTFTNYVLPGATNINASITSIKSSPNTLYIACNSLVYRSIDNGATWTNVSSNLPSVNWVRILSDEYFSSNEMVIVAGNNSVYFKQVTQTNWTLFSSALPARTTINDFSIYNDGTNQSMLRVSEYGRGMWEVPMTALRNVTADFTVNETSPCPGNSIQFTDLSIGTATSWSWTFPGGTPASSSLQNPTVTYTNPGIYDVTLQASDGVNSNTKTKTNYINSNGYGLPLIEGFESGLFPPAGWTLVDAGNDGVAWQLNASAGGFGNSTNSMYFNNFSNNVTGKTDEMRTKRYDMVGLATAQLTFDVAYQPYNTTNYSDTLEVLVSTNCGASFTSVYLKGGGILSTVAGTNTSAFVPSAGQWRTETVNLNGYISGSVLLSFKNLGHYGNNIYIDNINISGTFTTNAGTDKNICYGANTTIGSAAATGISYSWSPVSGLSSSTVSNPVASPLSTTTYILTATKTGSSIIAKDTVVVIVDTVPITSAINPVSCFGGSNGAIDLTFTSGIAPYTYQWNNGSTSQDRAGLLPGSYTVTITDGALCSHAYIYTITQPDSALNASTTATQAICNGSNGTATAIASGGTAPYTYNWSIGNTATISNLNPGTYTVTITDYRNCTSTASAVVTAKPFPIINSFTASAPPYCSGNSITLTVGASGGNVTNSFTSGNINLAIPDNTPAGVSSTIAINSGIILDAASKLSLQLNFGTTSTIPNREHTYVGDLKISLSTPGGNTFVFDRPGSPALSTGNSADLNGAYIFTISALDILPVLSASTNVVGGNVVNGNYKPSDNSNPEVAHNWTGLTFPLTVNGNWTLTISDNAGSDVGDLISWTLNLTPCYLHQFTGPGTIGSINCLTNDCSGANVIISNPAPGNNTYNVTTTSPDGCTVTSSVRIFVTATPDQPGTINGLVNVCEDDTIIYNVSPVNGATSYNWTTPSGWNIINGQGTTSISVDPSASNGNIVVTASNTCTSPPSTLAVNSGFCILTLTLKTYFESFYQTGGSMMPVADPFNFPTIYDTITVELHNSLSPYSLVHSATNTVTTNGTGQFVFPGSVLSNSYYIVVRHRNSLETWSKNPVLFNASTVNYDFTTP